MLRRTLIVLALAFAAARSAAAAEPAGDLRAAAARLADEAGRANDAYDGLSQLCDRIGNRISGSPQLDRAIEWAAARMRAEGLENVHTEKAMVPVWVRGHEEAEMLAPRGTRLHVLGLGMSVGTPRGGVTGEVVVVDSFPQLDALGPSLRGKIVLYDVPFRSYGETVRYRGAGASRAAKWGAIAVLVRSVGPVSLDTPHTGSLSYADTLPRIPAAAITIEGATLIHRLVARGETVRVRLAMEAHRLPDVPSANVVGEVRGRERPDEVVVVSGHLDSWDVGQGAQDDGIGCVLAMESAHLMMQHGLRPRRTVRVVLWTNEENGLRGGRAYRDAHRGDVANHVAMIETDSGNGLADGFGLDLRAVAAAGDSAGRDTTGLGAQRAAALATLQAFAPLLAPIGAGKLTLGGGGADIGPMAALGVPTLGLHHDEAHYFDVHHTEADTFDKIEPAAVRHNLAALAVMAYALAESPERLR